MKYIYPMKNVIRIIQIVLTLITAYGTYGLVQAEMNGGATCPEVFGISACYIVMGCVVAILVSFLSPRLHTLFSLGSSIAWGLAATGSYYQYKELAQCPKMDNGTSMCYIALGIFSTLLILDFIHGRIKKKKFG